MLGSITPLGERGRQGRWAITASFYLVGSLLAGTLLGGVSGLAGRLAFAIWQPSQAAILAGITVLALVAATVDAGVRHVKLPTVHRQVDRTWLDRYRGWVYGFGFGFQLGLGVTTIVTTAAVYLLVGVALLSASPSSGAVVGAVFGLARAVPVLATRRVTTADRLSRMHTKTERWQRRAQGVTIAMEALVATLSVIAILRPA
jgi:sulfite exporter TauE/SafE